MKRHHRKLRTMGVKHPSQLRRRTKYERIQKMQQKGVTFDAYGIPKQSEHYDLSYFPFGDEVTESDRRGGSVEIPDPVSQRRHRIAAAALAAGAPVLGALATGRGRRLIGAATGAALGIPGAAALLLSQPRFRVDPLPGTPESELIDAAGAAGLHDREGATKSIYTFRRRHGIDTPGIEVTS